MRKQNMDLVVIFIISFLLFSLPSMLRADDRGIIGFPTYYHQRIAQDILDTRSIPSYDSLSFGGRAFDYPPAFSVSLALFAAVAGMFAGGVIMLALFGAIAIIVVYLIVMELFHDRKAAILASVIAMLMPASVFAFSHLCSRAPPIALSLAAIYLLLREEKRPYIAMALIGIVALFHLETALIFAVLTVPSLRDIWADSKKRVILPIALLVLIAGSFYIPFFVQHGFIEYNAIHEDYRSLDYSMQSSGPREYFIELSPYANATIISVVLALIGFIFARSDRNINYIRLWLIFMFALSLVFERFLIYMPVPLSIMAVIGISVIYNRVPKKVFYIIIIAILIWSAAGAAIKIGQMTNEYPIAAEYKAFLWIKNNTPQNATVVSDWDYGHWVSGIADRKNFMDGYAEYAPQVNEHHAEYQSLVNNFTVPALLVNETSIYLYAEAWSLEKYHNIADYTSRFSLVYSDSGILVMKLR